MFNVLTRSDHTTVALAGSATYTSAAALTCSGYAKIIGTVFANVAGTLNVDQSPDGTNWDYTSTVAVSASSGTSFEIDVFAPFFRLRYVNGASGQTTFRLFSFLRGI